MKHERAKTAVWWVIIGLTVLFIWGQSLLGRELSRAQSESVQEILTSLLGEEAYNFLFVVDIRKVAHFAEYTLLGMEWAGYRLSVQGARRPPCWLLCVFGPAIAACDELLQFISARAPMVTDMLIDCGGYVCGVVIVCGAVWLCRRLRKD